MNKNQPFAPPLILFLLAILALFLVACATPLPPATLPATISANAAADPEPTATTPPQNTATPTAVSPTPTSIPPTPLPTETPAPQLYTVQAGDTLTLIADTFGTTAASIQQANEIVDSHAIYVGQELVIPAETAVVGALDEAAAERGILHNQYLCPSLDEVEWEGGTVIGQSAVCQIPIVSYQFGEGETSLVLVGGMHGGYEWNSILLTYEFLDHLRLNSETIPDALNIIVIPNANPDGLYAVTRQIGRFTEDDVDADAVPGRFNGNFVDLNRNWDCEWAPNATWQDNPVSGGAAPFSEPENQSLRDFLVAAEPAAVVLYHSAAAGVYAAGCGRIDPASDRLTTVYRQASGYPQNDGFQHYDITGDASNWLAAQGIPAMTVELTTHEAIDWRMNLAGLTALINHLAAETAVD